MCSRVYAGGMLADDTADEPSRWDAGGGDDLEQISKRLGIGTTTEDADLFAILSKLTERSA